MSTINEPIANGESNGGIQSKAQVTSLHSDKLNASLQQTPEQSSPSDSPTVATSQEETRPLLSTLDQVSLNQTLKGIMDVLSRYNAISIRKLDPFLLIQGKISKSDYKHPDEFKHDIDRLFTKVRSVTTAQRQNDIDQLYQSVIASMKLEIDRTHPNLMDSSTLDSNYQQSVRTALFRPTLDGFIFTDANAIINQLDEPLPSKVQAIAIHPTPSENFTVPTLKQSVQQPYRFPPRYSKHEDKPIVPVQWLDYGVFTSFAPVCDSNNANTSYEWTYMGRAAKRHRRWERKQRRTLLQSRKSLTQHKQQAENMDLDLDEEWLREQGLDAHAIINNLATENHTNDDDDDTATLLERNGKLIEMLQSHQESRFNIASSLSSSVDSQAVKVDDHEQETANKLQRQFHTILSQLPPSAVIHPEDIETAMSRLPMKEAVYRGTLPSSRIFAYPSSDRVDASPPPFANITPTYSKDLWRMIDLQGHDIPTPPPVASASPSSSQQPHTSHTSSPFRS